jgi:hypothetical protein
MARLEGAEAVRRAVRGIAVDCVMNAPHNDPQRDNLPLN